jgi:probable HAF family extracellular repeat protein
VEGILPVLNHEHRRKTLMKTIVGAALLTLTSFAALPAQADDPRYTLTDLGPAPEGVLAPTGGTLKMGINDRGDVAASRALISNGPPGVRSQAFLYRNGRITLIPNPNLTPFGYGGSTYGSAVNTRGIAVGFQKDPEGSGPSAPFLFNAKGKITPLPVLLRSGRAYDINDNGYVTGLAGVSHVVNSLHSQVFLYDGRTIRGIGPVSEIGGPLNIGFGLNDRNEVVGVISGHAFYYNGIGIADLGTLGGKTSVAMAINIYSEIVGEADTADGKQHAFLFADGRMFDLGLGQANAINDDRLVVGQTGPTLPSGPNTSVAFLWDREIHDLNGLIAAKDPLRGKVHLTQAQAINNRGKIVAEDCSTASTTSTCEIYILTPTEEKLARR